MLCNQYDNQTGRYVASFLAERDPMDASRYLVPAFCTLTPLPEVPTRSWPFWQDGKWKVQPDYRGVRLYRTDTGEPGEITVAGVSPGDAGLTDVPRPSDEYVWKDGAWVLDEAVVAERVRAAAMADFYARMEKARQQNLGKSDARVTGLLSDIDSATFDAWAAYQVALVGVVDLPTFPNDVVWPAEPDPAALLAKVEAQRAEKAAREAEEAARREAEAAHLNEAVETALDAESAVPADGEGAGDNEPPVEVDAK
ncbi:MULTISPECIES: tail fiber assembly protein [unclassified Burkholderia]|uniref:tail fiber assembly protein n=1 Tax=unclassified Burkholderia TaxID=2613784 RepID=UPI000F58085F|nr:MULTISPECIES: tail fiber assembly protein [unclassified Burkholderia]RQR45593.1 phage tail protein [Burkholderia sp. Bp9131]RQR77680.1 phage tail protein [Burkholderia sp. Bp9015]